MVATTLWANTVGLGVDSVQRPVTTIVKKVATHGKSLASLAALISLLRVFFASSLTFELPYWQRKCFTEDLPPDTVTRVMVHVASGQGEMTLNLFVSDLKGVVHFQKSNVDSVKFLSRHSSN